jgi:hypothetical protein
MQTLRKSTIVVAVLVVSIGAFRANVAYAADVLFQEDSSGSTPTINFTLTSPAVINAVTGGCSLPSPVSNPPRLLLTTTSGGNPATYNILPNQSPLNLSQVLWRANFFGAPIDANTPVAIVLDGTIPAGSACNIGVTGETGTTAEMNALSLAALDWGVKTNTSLSIVLESGSGLSSPTISFTVTSPALLVRLDSGCDSSSPFPFPPLLATLTFRGNPVPLTIPAVQYSASSAVWKEIPVFAPPIDANTTVTIGPVGSIPSGTNCNITATLVTGTALPPFYVERLTGGKNIFGLTPNVQSSTGPNPMVTYTMPSGTYGVVTGVNGGCSQPTNAPAPTLELIVNSTINNIPVNQSSSDPYAPFWNSAGFGSNPAGPGTNVIVEPSAPIVSFSSCSVTLAMLTGTKSAVDSANLFREFAYWNAIKFMN